MPISAAVCMFQPGSVKSGGTWQLAQLGLAVEQRLAARRGGGSKLPRGGARRGQRELIERAAPAASA